MLGEDDFLDDGSDTEDVSDLPPLLTQLSNNSGRILIEECTPEQHSLTDYDRQSLVSDSETESVLDLDAIQPQLAPESTEDPDSKSRIESVELLQGVQKMMSSNINKRGKISIVQAPEEEEEEKETDGVRREIKQIDDSIFEELD